jgi:formylglycine-generating enzyme required for sulfatase activity
MRGKQVLFLSILVLALSCENPAQNPSEKPGKAPEGFVEVPGGTVTGSVSYAIGEEKGIFVEGRVVAIETFYMARSLTTWELWSEVCAWARARGYVFDSPGQQGASGNGDAPWKGENQPVARVLAEDAMVWCNAYSEKTGRVPVYYTPSGEILRSAIDAPDAVTDRSTSGFRLPTEAEWEFAARGGNPEASEWLYRYSGGPSIAAVAWYQGNSSGHTHPAGLKKPNNLGLYDMSGNIQELCQDFWTGEISADTPPYGPAQREESNAFYPARVIRGGGYNESAVVAWRGKTGYVNGSFRLVSGSAETENISPDITLEMYFDYGRRRTDRDPPEEGYYTIPLGRTLVIAPVVWGAGAEKPVFQWKLDGVVQASTTEYFSFTPAAQGEYTISVSAALDIARGEAVTKALCTAPEGTYKRPANGTSRLPANKVFAYVQGPDEFIGLYPKIDNSRETAMTEEEALQIAQWYLEGDPRAEPGRAYWDAFSLGAWGGYGIFGFDHSIDNLGGYDLTIKGNAFGGWEEPGALWVSQDDNGNGEPDDTWYELKGSMTGEAGTIQRYARTFYIPKDGGSPFYRDNQGDSGESYAFPWFLHSGSVTYTGTFFVPPRAKPLTGYVDTVQPQKYRISDAIQQDGTPIHLDYIDFVKIQDVYNGTEFYTPRDGHGVNSDARITGVPTGKGTYSYTFINNTGYSLDVYLLADDFSQLERIVVSAGQTAARTLNIDHGYVDVEGGNVTASISGGAATFEM